MHLSKIVVENYRSFKYLEAELVSGLNVLVGRNNTGKSNLLCAIRHALGPAASRGDALWLDRDDFYRAGPEAEPASKISVKLIFDGLSETQRSHFFEIMDFNLTDMSKSQAIIRMQGTWSAKREQVLVRRTGGASTVDAQEVSQAILASLPITFLPALRDAEAALAPGQRSRLALMLKALSERSGRNDKEEIEEIFAEANQRIETQALIAETKKSLMKTTRELAGTDHIPSTIKASNVSFGKILRTLRVQMENVAVEDLDANGLGYNNLLYMAVVLEHLKDHDPEGCALLLVEEPEAHLHPQLIWLLSDYLANNTPGSSSPQTLVTTHSPTMGSSVPPSRVNVLFTGLNREACCHSVNRSGMNEKESLALRRMMDLTRAALYFAKGVILVEGISEALLLPVLAKRIGRDLGRLHISVIPIAGVAFETFAKLFQPDVLGVPVAIVTDADPIVENRDLGWKEHLPRKDGTKFQLCDRTKKLLNLFADHPTVSVFHSQVTLEHDLAEAGDENAKLMAEV